MKDILRQAGVIVSILITLVVNTLANALPLNGLNTGQISDRFNVYFVPAGYVFSIWGLIYIGLIAYGIFQALPAQRDNPRLRSTGWWIALGGLANSAWIFLWHYQQFPATLVAMFLLLATLIITYLYLGIGRSVVSKAENWAVRIPFSVYLGWITVATVANVTSVLDYLKWDRFDLAPEVWMSIMLAVVLAITLTMIITRRDTAFSAVILWALAGIAVKFVAVPAVMIPTWITFGVIALGLVFVLVGRKPNQQKR
jgi:hypothetical protein